MTKDDKQKVKGKKGVEELHQQVGDLTEALQRERADAVNQRRLHDEQYARLQSSVKAQVLQELLPAIDNLERALKHAPKELEGNDYVKGVQSVVKQFDKTLTDLSVERIQTVGHQFDPNLHEAVGMEDGAGEIEVVCEELQSGYRLGDYIIRPAMVRVRREPAQTQQKVDSNKQENKEEK